MSTPKCCKATNGATVRLHRLLAAEQLLMALGLPTDHPSRRTYKLRQQGLPFVRIGRGYKYPVEAVSRFLLGQSRG